MSRSIGTTDGYKGDRSSIGSVRESELPIVPIISQGQHNPDEIGRRGNAFIMLLKKGQVRAFLDVLKSR